MGPNPIRLTSIYSQNRRNAATLIAKVVNNGLPLLLTKFLNSRREGTSPATIDFYRWSLQRFVDHYQLTADGIRQYLHDLKCGMRLSELATVKAEDINWNNNTITVWGKGKKQRLAPFTEYTAQLLKQVVNSNTCNIWNLECRGIQIMLKRLGEETGLPTNPHTFRRTFASNLHRAGIDVEHIMRLGGWSSLNMVLLYTKSVKFEDSLKIYQSIQNN